jgi:hypothetical protein
MSAKIFRFPPRRVVIDILRMELDGKLPHWLSPLGRIDRVSIRAKHRAAYLANRKR